MSNNINTDKILLLGAGRMGFEYAKILQKLNVPFFVIGRGKKSAERFHEVTRINVQTGGLENWLKQNEIIPYTAIVAVSVEELSNTTNLLLDTGVKSILVEKPGGINLEEIQKIAETAKKKNAKVYVALNRRFYASTLKAIELIEEDGGITSFHFEFTEWSHLINNNNKLHPEVKKNWFLANSSHVVDMAFFLGGRPVEMNCFKKGGLEWHPASSVFTGAGISERGALFSYQANWNAPGSWKVEMLTTKRRLIFNPLEKLYVQKNGSLSIEKIVLNDSYDQKFKPGLYLQTASFLGFINRGSLVSIDDWLYWSSDFLKIAY